MEHARAPIVEFAFSSSGCPRSSARSYLLNHAFRKCRSRIPNYLATASECVVRLQCPPAYFG